MTLRALVAPDANQAIVSGTAALLAYQELGSGSIGQAPNIAGLTGRTLHYLVSNGVVGTLTVLTGLNTLGCSAIAPSMIATPAQTMADLRQSSVRSSAGALAANTQIGYLPEQNVVRGSATSWGGWFMAWRCAFSVIEADTRFFVGVASAAIGAANPSTVVSTVGFGSDTGDANVTLLSVDGAGAATKTAIGAGLVKATLDTGDPVTNLARVLEFQLWAAPGATSVQARLYDWSNGAWIIGPTPSDITLTLPVNTTPLRPQINLSVGASGTQVTVQFMHWYGYY